MHLENQFSDHLNQLFDHQFPHKIAVAVSGGVDSMALLLLLEKFCKNKNTKIFCLTVDHQSRADSAADAHFVADFCHNNFINCQILRSNIPQKRSENSWRQIRYELLAEFCQQNNIDHLFTGHHAGDGAENFLIRLFRGSGIDGLAAMEAESQMIISGQKITLMRPLLDFKKAQLEEFLRANEVSWIHDASNENDRFLRNKIRQFLASLPDVQNVENRVNQASNAILEAKNILQNQTQEQFPKIFKFNDQIGYFTVDFAAFRGLPKEKAGRYLALALMQISGQMYKPRREKLERICCKIHDGKLFKSCSFYGCILEKLNDGEIVIYRESSAIKAPERIAGKVSKNTIFDGRFKISLASEILKKSPIVENIDAAQLNILLKKERLQLGKMAKDPLKKTLYTVPVMKINQQIIAIPAIGFYQNEKLREQILVATILRP